MEIYLQVLVQKKVRGPLLTIIGYFLIIFLAMPYLNEWRPNIHALHEAILFILCIDIPILFGRFLFEVYSVLSWQKKQLFSFGVLVWLLSMASITILILFSELTIEPEVVRTMIASIIFSGLVPISFSLYVRFYGMDFKGFRSYIKTVLRYLIYLPVIGYWFYDEVTWSVFWIPTAWPMYLVSPWFEEGVFMEHGFWILGVGGIMFAYGVTWRVCRRWALGDTDPES